MSEQGEYRLHNEDEDGQDLLNEKKKDKKPFLAILLIILIILIVLLVILLSVFLVGKKNLTEELKEEAQGLELNVETINFNNIERLKANATFKMNLLVDDDDKYRGEIRQSNLSIIIEKDLILVDVAFFNVPPIPFQDSKASISFNSDIIFHDEKKMELFFEKYSENRDSFFTFFTKGTILIAFNVKTYKDIVISQEINSKNSVPVNSLIKRVKIDYENFDFTEIKFDEATFSYKGYLTVSSVLNITGKTEETNVTIYYQNSTNQNLVPIGVFKIPPFDFSTGVTSFRSSETKLKFFDGISTKILINYFSNNTNFLFVKSDLTLVFKLDDDTFEYEEVIESKTNNVNISPDALANGIIIEISKMNVISIEMNQTAQVIIDGTLKLESLMGFEYGILQEAMLKFSHTNTFTNIIATLTIPSLTVKQKESQFSLNVDMKIEKEEEFLILINDTINQLSIDLFFNGETRFRLVDDDFFIEFKSNTNSETSFDATKLSEVEPSNMSKDSPATNDLISLSFDYHFMNEAQFAISHNMSLYNSSIQLYFNGSIIGSFQPIGLTLPPGTVLNKCLININNNSPEAVTSIFQSYLNGNDTSFLASGKTNVDLGYKSPSNLSVTMDFGFVLSGSDLPIIEYLNVSFDIATNATNAKNATVIFSFTNTFPFNITIVSMDFSLTSQNAECQIESHLQVDQEVRGSESICLPSHDNDLNGCLNHNKTTDWKFTYVTFNFKIDQFLIQSVTLNDVIPAHQNDGCPVGNK